MNALAAELRQANPSLTVYIAVADLSTTTGREQLWQTVDALPQKPNLLINNAGLGDYGIFSNASDSRIQQQIDLNITSLTLITRHFLSRVQATASSPAAVLNVSSLAGAVPVPDLAVYAATKAYVTSFTEAVAVELRSQHIFISAVCPGPTPTNFGNNAQRKGERDIDRGGQDLLKIPPQRVVAEGLRIVREGGILVYPGKRVTLAAFVFRVMPRFLMRFVLRKRFNRSVQKSQIA